MTTHEVLVAARNYLDHVGWCKRPGGAYGMAGRPQCALGAIHATVGEVDPTSPAVMELFAQRRCDDGPGSSVINWNDAPERTKGEVLALFDKAIAATAPAPADPFPHGVPEEVVA